jgi:tryptophan halogenase
MINNICILGGGTAGLISALMIKSAFQNLKVTVIESSKIGIIGVGEGSTEHWSKFMHHINISTPDIVRETDATFKLGIKFTNWHGDGTSYYHSLTEEYGGVSDNHGIRYSWLRMLVEDWDPIDTVHDPVFKRGRFLEPLATTVHQYHFDTHKLNNYLHKLCSKRGISVIDAEINDVILDEQGYVKELIDADNNTYPYEFYIDGSGFNRIISKKLGAKWIDCSAQLPMNSAIAFPTTRTDEIPGYTESTALSSGWCWRIPTQNRYGNGYVFCDDFISETQAYDEVSMHYKKLGIADNLEIGKKVKFNAGYVDKFWIKNCVSVGLSGMFVEPLEASSIGATIQQIAGLAGQIFYYERGNDVISNLYNTTLEDVAKNIIDFIQLHYFTQRTDSEFWRWCKNNIAMTEFNSQYLEHFKQHSVNGLPFLNRPLIMFGDMNYTQVMHGLRMFKNNEYLKSKYNNHIKEAYEHIADTTLRQGARADDTIPWFTHRAALEELKNRGMSIEYKF